MPKQLFEKGNTLGKGRPKGARNKITEQTEAMLATMTKGAKAKQSLEKLRDEQPGVFWKVVAGLLPKHVEVTADVSVTKIESTIVDPKNQSR